MQLIVDEIGGKDDGTGPLTVCGDLCVVGEIKNGNGLPACIPLLSVDKIQACGEGETIVVCDDLCIAQGKVLATDTITCKTIDGETGMGAVCIDPKCKLVVNKIGGKEGYPVTICDDLCVLGELVTDTIRCKTTDPYGHGTICIDEDCKLLVDQIGCKTYTYDGTSVQGAICIDPMCKLLVDKIGGKPDAGGDPGPLTVCDDLCVLGAVETDMIRCKTGGTVCIDPKCKLLVDNL